MAAGDLNDLRDTWNNAGTTFRGIKLNATDTASAAGSLLMELLKDNVRKFEVGKDSSIRYGPDASNYWQHLVSATGDLALTGVGSTGGAFTVTPAAGKNFNVALSGTGLQSLSGNIAGDFISRQINAASANTINSVILEHRLRSSASERSAFIIRSSLNVIDDSTRNSLVQFQTNQSGLFQTAISIDGGKVLIGNGTPAALLHVSQPSTTAAIPVLRLGQSDLSEEMIRFNATVGIGNPIEAVGAKVLTVTHYVRMFIEGVGARYLALGTIA